eukprot:225101-Chlamydomonas_euryale.AAC.15
MVNKTIAFDTRQAGHVERQEFQIDKADMFLLHESTTDHNRPQITNQQGVDGIRGRKAVAGSQRSAGLVWHDLCRWSFCVCMQTLLRTQNTHAKSNDWKVLRNKRETLSTQRRCQIAHMQMAVRVPEAGGGRSVGHGSPTHQDTALASPPASPGCALCWGTASAPAPSASPRPVGTEASQHPQTAVHWTHASLPETSSRSPGC